MLLNNADLFISFDAEGMNLITRSPGAHIKHRGVSDKLSGLVVHYPFIGTWYQCSLTIITLYFAVLLSVIILRKLT